MSQGGKENADRVAALVARTRKIMAAGLVALGIDLGPCECFYDDGLPRYVTPDKRPAHRCGR